MQQVVASSHFATWALSQHVRVLFCIYIDSVATVARQRENHQSLRGCNVLSYCSPFDSVLFNVQARTYRWVGDGGSLWRYSGRRQSIPCLAVPNSLDRNLLLIWVCCCMARIFWAQQFRAVSLRCVNYGSLVIAIIVWKTLGSKFKKKSFKTCNLTWQTFKKTFKFFEWNRCHRSHVPSNFILFYTFKITNKSSD